jgi:hypothetical protein
MFDLASRLKLRFTFTKDLLTTEDLWDLSLEQLNLIAKDLNKQVNSSKEEDFLKEKSDVDKVLKLKFDIVIHILRTKQNEKNENEIKLLRKSEKEKLLNILDRKRELSLETLSEDEIKKKIKELE